MKSRKTIGWLLLVSPYAAAAILLAAECGIGRALAMFAVVLLCTVMALAGIVILTAEEERERRAKRTKQKRREARRA